MRRVGSFASILIFTLLSLPHAILADVPKPPCCSSVAFLPALEASRLYTPGLLFENRLWEPNRNADVEKLFLDANGTPLISDIYTRDAIDEIYGAFGNIYKTFFHSLDALVAGGTIAAWQVLPYDWRLNPETILEDGISLESGGSYDLIHAIEILAADSKTGKVTLVAHSNGGLLAQELIERLKGRGEEGLIDTLILVAVPQLGTPQTIPVLLHGQGQSHGFGFILNEPTARTLAENMPAGYNLIPSPGYFGAMSEPVVTFDPDAGTLAPYRATYGDAVDSFNELYDFLLGHEGRTKPVPSDITDPNVLNQTLLDRSLPTRDFLDHWAPPIGLRVVQVAGWGLDTLAGVHYTEREEVTCPLVAVSCITREVIDYEPQFVIDGDDTVVVPSALKLSTAEEYYLNLFDYNRRQINPFITNDHSNILEVEPIQELIHNLVAKIPVLPDGIAADEPVPSQSDTRFRLAVHSPVSLDLYDESGAHTGLSKPFGPSSDLSAVEDQIPNSYYLEFGEGKYAGVANHGKTKLVLTGESLGTISLSLVELSGDTVSTSTSFSDIPVTAGSTLTINDLTGPRGLQLQADADGDGVVDAVISPGEGISAEEFLDLFRGIVRTLHLPPLKERKLLKSLDKIEKVLEKEWRKEAFQKRRLNTLFDWLNKTIGTLVKKKLINSDEATDLLAVIQNLKLTVSK